MIESPHLGRLRWRCRRGMLELDLVFERFWARHCDTLQPEQALQLEELLELEEAELWEILSGRRELGVPRLQGMIDLLRQT